MLEFVIFSVTSVVALLCILIYFYQGASRPSRVPGLEPTTKEDGNLADIGKAGGLFEFLMHLHKQFGPIASFWMGPQYVVSISSPELFKEHQGVFDRPPSLFKLFEPLLGPRCILYANKTDGRTRRKNYDKVFSHNHIKAYYPQYQEKANDLERKWSSLAKEEHIPLSAEMFAYTVRVILLTSFGESFKDDKDVIEFRRCFDICWDEMERSLTDVADPDSPRQKAFEEALTSAKKFIKKAVQKYKDKPSNPGEEILMDVLIQNTTDEETLLNDALTFFVGGFNTTGNLLTWCFYFLAKHMDVQEKLNREIKENLGKLDVDHTNIADLPYARQVLDESLRCSILAPWAARFQDFEAQLGGYKLPKNTPVIHALGVAMQNEKHWRLPDKFDPDRFSSENAKFRPAMAFQPFGFAGKRMCPGYRFAYGEATVCLVTLIRKFKIALVEGQVIHPVHGLVTHPDEEIWIKIEKR